MRVACVGSRSLEAGALRLCRELGRAVTAAKHALVTGGARGADAAFARGAAEGNPRRLTVYLPWEGFAEGFHPESVVSALEEFEEGFAAELAAEAERHHPRWDACSPQARLCLARNALIARGADLMLAYPRPGWCGTRHAMRCGKAAGAEVLDLSAACDAALEDLRSLLAGEGLL